MRGKHRAIERDGAASVFVTVTAGQSRMQESDVDTRVTTDAAFNWRYLFAAYHTVLT